MHRIGRGVAWGVLSVVAAASGAAGQGAGDGRLRLVGSTTRDDLDAVVTPTISRDGKFLYTASWRPAAIGTFAIDPDSGKLDHRRTFAEEELIGGTTAISLSPDGRLAVAPAFRSRTVALFLRDVATGELDLSDVARDGEKDVRFPRSFDADFSPDGKFVHVLDEDGSDGQGAVVTFRVAEGRLALVATDEGVDGCYAGARGLAIHPDGTTLFVVASGAGTLVVVGRDKVTGKTAVRQVVRDEEGDVHGLAGAMGVVVSPDGKFVYVSSGRIRGDDAVSTFQVGADGRVALLQEFVNGRGDFRGFEGGNHLAISPDGLNVYATATRSSSLACFRREKVTGKLSYLETLRDGSENAKFGAAGVAVSPDGRFVYVATEDGRAITQFVRDGPRKHP